MSKEEERPPLFLSGTQRTNIGKRSTGQDEVLNAITVTDSRSQWGNRLEFILSCIGYSVGLGNVWRFPYLCVKHGGAAFLLVYLIMQLFIGKPLYFMELAAGQYAAKGPVHVWDMNPAARGIGFTMCLFSLQVSLYYNVIMSYVLYFFFSSFLVPLPWTTCDPSWTEICFDHGTKMPEHCKMPAQGVIPNSSIECQCADNKTIDSLFNCSEIFRPSDLFFKNVVSQQSDNLSMMGTPSWRLALLLLISWIIVLLCIIKGIHTTGKVVYFTATCPYVILTILLVRGATLDGAIDGVLAFIIPDMKKLLDPQLWADAAGQMFFSLSLSMGGILMFGSFNRFHNPVYVDAVIVSSMDMFTSIISGLVIYTTLGYKAKMTNKSIKDVSKGGYGLAFEAYPETLSTLAAANFWSVMFFFMLFILGLDSQFTLVETVTTYLIDDFAVMRRNKIKMRAAFSVFLYLIGLALICPGGYYLIEIIDTYGVNYPITVIAALETVSIMWVYGFKRFMVDLEYMLGKKPPLLPYWYFVWLIFDPLVLLIIFILTLSKSKTPTYPDKTEFGSGAMVLCWAVYIVTLSPVVVWFFMYAAAVHRRHGFHSFAVFINKLFEPGPRFGSADGMHPEATRRVQSVFADILDWERLHPKSNTTTAGSGGRVGSVEQPEEYPPHEDQVICISPTGNDDVIVGPSVSGESGVDREE